MSEAPTALVTGGGGFLGRRIVRLLLERGCRVRVLGRRAYPELERAGVECLVGDVRDPLAVGEAVDGARTVFHTAALAGVWGPRGEFFGINARGTHHVLEACLARGVERLVLTSSPSVVYAGGDVRNGDESLPYPDRYLADYPASKAVAEREVLAANGARGANGHSLSTCALRPHLIWGPGDPHLVPRIVRSAWNGRLRRVGDGTNRVDLTYVDNAAWAHVTAAEAMPGPDSPPGGRAYFIGDAEPVVLWDWIAALLDRVGAPPVGRHISYRSARLLGAVFEAIHRAVPFLGEPPMTRFVSTQLAFSHYFNHSAAARDFGYRPVVDADTGLHRTLACLRGGGVWDPSAIGL
jgi:nucleoside-diphosphate-sugar epimerase